MNYLFYLGIIAPTLITIFLFVIFVYCWFLQKARKEVMTKKYDPHGKMRRLGIPMDPPLPPAYCRINDNTRFIDNGEDNEAYDVSRSPSTEQDQRGRPMYHTYHDSGISAGLSPSQEQEPRPGLSYRTCPDSGISGFSIQTPGSGSQHHICRGCCQAREQMPQLHHQPHLQHQQTITRPHYLPQHQQVTLHHNTVQASVHPAHGVCYGDEMTHPQSPQHYNPPPFQTSTFNIVSPTAYNGRQFTTMPHIHEQPSHMSPTIGMSQGVCYCSDSSDQQSPDGQDPQPYCPEEGLDSFIQEHSLNPPIAYPSTFRPQNPRTMALMSSSMALTSSSTEDSIQPDNQVSSSTSSINQRRPDIPSSYNGYTHQAPKVAPQSSPATQPPRHSNSTRDSGVLDLGQALNASDRPDSQASTSSTTDSEDSGFRSSHCAAHHTSNMNKHGHPLLKPLRRPKNSKSRSKPTRGGGDDPSVQGATPLSTLNPQKLQCQIPTNAKPHVIQTTSLQDEQQGQPSPPRILQQQHAIKSTLTSFSDSLVHNSIPNYQNDSSSCRSPPISSNQDSTVRQQPDGTEISTHLSWKYLQDLSVSSNSSHESCNSQDGLQLCHTGLSKEPQFTQEPQLEMFSYSVV